MKKLWMITGCAAVAATTMADVTVDFDGLSTSGNNTYVVPQVNWEQSGITFTHSFTDWGGGSTSWDGMVYSSVDDTTTPGYGNQYAVYADGSGTDVSGNGSYGVFYQPYTASRSVILPVATTVRGFYANNTTYGALSIRDGDGFSRAFNTASNDVFTLSVHAYDSSDNLLGTQTLDLADYTGETGKIVDEWTYVELESLGSTVKSLEFNFSSTAAYKPTYFAMDELTVAAVPEPSTAILAAGGFAGVLWFRRRRSYFFRG
ncbi:DUF4465 domain-containing protein [Pontiellaceae bacterium B1224]|nr:DUF4465 domain-containing protein [Pontiellaceae bacterium B1224]